MVVSEIIFGPSGLRPVINCENTLYSLLWCKVCDVIKYVVEPIIIRNKDTNFVSIKIKILTITSFFNIVSLLFNALLSSLHKLVYALRQKMF